MGKKTKETKECNRCHEIQIVSKFPVYSASKDGRRPTCRACLKKEAEDNRALYTATDTKTCNKCGKIKYVSEFHLCQTNKCGLKSSCKECSSDWWKQNYKKTYVKHPKPPPEVFEEGKSRCSYCKKILDITEFGEGTRKPHMIHHYCKNCTCLKALENRQNIRSDPELFELARQKRHSKPYVEKWATDSIYHHNNDGYKCSFTKEELIEKAKNTPCCEYCGIELSWNYDNPQNGLGCITPTLENLECAEYITFDKMHIVCRNFNLSKGGRNREQFLAWMEVCTKNINKLHPEEIDKTLVQCILRSKKQLPESSFSELQNIQDFLLSS